jgi:vacuolar-type H+-ATPase subunit E/Vma4
MKLFLATEELRVHGQTDVERIGTRADADTERLAEEDVESAEERRRSAYRLT